MKTPQKPYPDLAQKLGLTELWFKREDLHPYGSHKGRSIPLMIKEYAKTGVQKFVLSSSGNAALAALIATQKHNQNNPTRISLTLYVGQHIDPNKLQRLEKEITDKNTQIEQVENPKQAAFQKDKNGEAKNLRQSTDELALKGYLELAEDLNKIPNLCAVFLPTSSGTTAQALGEAFLKMGTNIQIHIVQTTACHPLAEVFDTERATSNEGSLAGAIVDKVAHRKEKVIEAIHNTHGSGWIITDDEIKKAEQIIKENTEFTASPNSALSLAGLLRAKEKNWHFPGPVCCVITGR